MAKKQILSRKDKERIYKLLKEYHKIFPKLKCKSDCLEHIIAKAIDGKVLGGHNKEADIKVNDVGIQIKSCP